MKALCYLFGFIAIFFSAPSPTFAEHYKATSRADTSYNSDSLENDNSEDNEISDEYPEDDNQETHSTCHTVLFYLPNRLLDLLDIVRARVRVGPGVAAGVRATDAIDLFFGSYISAYIGLPGPRQGKSIVSPVGVESYNGAELSLAKATADFGFGPHYSFTEVGADAQIAFIGVDIAIDPAEIVDFIGGIFLFDIKDDDN